ncbi:hypothetical protein J7T55_015222 [Diaporthe amygdali]|uniref:uncharacterized protein n=1 Tax=Phomopsis amygdali TaxID=1214568 RepID=UPI0022FF1FD4|nr:uncharacterized protein J7T55_015222 [Diaporthe amygdali]KAJ0120493.1 hypothetical protein J7T55_015222 [Diaporthe amygdali]
MSNETTKDQHNELATVEQLLLEADHIPQWLKDSVIRSMRPRQVQFWSPPDDPDKPKYLKTVTHSEAVVANPPNETPASTEHETAQLTIAAPIAVGEARGPQIVACTVIPLQENRVTAEPFQAAAKFFDKSMGTDAFHYPEEYRLEVLARAMDGYVRQLKTGLAQGDFAGRNVVLVTNNQQEETICGLTIPRVVLIDYNRAKVDKMSPEQAEWLPCNPGAIFWGELLCGSFGGWVPNDWEDVEMQQQWLLERFEKSEQRRLYYPSSEFFSQQLNKTA